VNRKPLSPVIGEKAAAVEGVLVVRLRSGRGRVIELAWGPNRFLAGIGSRKSGRHVPVEMVHGVRVFRVGLVQLAGEDLRFFLEPSLPQDLDLGTVRWTICAR
jgi:hypothetical protein